MGIVEQIVNISILGWTPALGSTSISRRRRTLGQHLARVTHARMAAGSFIRNHSCGQRTRLPNSAKRFSMNLVPATCENI